MEVTEKQRYLSRILILGQHKLSHLQLLPVLEVLRHQFNKTPNTMNLYELKESRAMRPQTFSAMLSILLYERRFGPYYVEPVIAGLDPHDNTPYVCNMDMIGCPNEPEDFVVAGTCAEQLYGMCEALWEPKLKPDQLFETISQSLVNAADRDAISGWGAVVYVIEKDKITEKHVKTRMD